jgi:DNA repair protein NreA
MIGKGAYLRQLTASTMPMQSAPVGREIDGSTPPSVFIGSWNYPDVFAGPMVAPLHGDTAVMDQPEAWISGNKTQEEIIGYRLNLIRGKQQVNAADLDNRLVEKLREISLSGTSLESEIAFTSTPAGQSFSEEHTPFGPSAEIEHFAIEAGRWDRDLERAYYDTDLLAADAVMGLHREGIPFSSIQKAFSVGTMGQGRGRHLVPTRWSITACDTIIGNNLLSTVKKNPVIDTWRVHEFSSLHNHYAVILMPTGWQYEWSEAFLHVLGNEELVFSDHEGTRKKTTYSPLGGCYYSCKMAVLEALAREQEQAGAIILREALRGYVPMGSSMSGRMSGARCSSRLPSSRGSRRPSGTSPARSRCRSSGSSKRATCSGR